MPNNPYNGLTLQELMMSEQLIPANNLADLPSLATALSNLMGVSVIASVSFSVAAGASNICILTGTIKDRAGNTIAGVRELEVYISEAATGVGVTADTYSTGASITTGTLVATLTANKAWRLLTNSSGVFAISITDTAKPADQYLVAVNPVTRDLSVSAASAALWGA